MHRPTGAIHGTTMPVMRDIATTNTIGTSTRASYITGQVRASRECVRMP